MRLIIEEVIMSDTHMSNGQIFPYLQLIFKTNNQGLDSTVTDYVLFILISIPL